MTAYYQAVCGSPYRTGWYIMTDACANYGADGLSTANTDSFLVAFHDSPFGAAYETKYGLSANNGAGTVAVQSFIPPMSLEQGGLLSAAIVSVWALAFVFRTVKKTTNHM